MRNEKLNTPRLVFLFYKTTRYKIMTFLIGIFEFFEFRSFFSPDEEGFRESPPWECLASSEVLVVEEEYLLYIMEARK